MGCYLRTTWLLNSKYALFFVLNVFNSHLNMWQFLHPCRMLERAYCSTTTPFNSPPFRLETQVATLSHDVSFTSVHKFFVSIHNIKCFNEPVYPTQPKYTCSNWTRSGLEILEGEERENLFCMPRSFASFYAFNYSMPSMYAPAYKAGSIKAWMSKPDMEKMDKIAQNSGLYSIEDV